MLSQLDDVELQLKARLMAGANVNERDLDGWTALRYAATRGCVQSGEALVDACADVNIADHYGITPLHSAMCNDHLMFVQVW